MPYPYDAERARALKAFCNHELTIEHDDGVFRSLFCGQPSTSNYHFRIVTWPGHLAISGDIGTFVWSRTRDMFEFFATADDWAGMPLKINAGYWAEKLQASDTHGGGCGNTPRSSVQYETLDVAWIKKQAVRRFREISLSNFRPNDGHLLSGRMSAWQDLRNVLESLSEDDSVEDAIRMIGEWSPDTFDRADSWTRRDPLFDYDEYSDFINREYDFTYLVCCFAVVWAIKRYAQVKQSQGVNARSEAMQGGAA